MEFIVTRAHGVADKIQRRGEIVATTSRSVDEGSLIR
jgi:hypothetical protein